MKKLFILLFVIAIGCTIDYSDSAVDNPSKTTTIEIQNTVIDSCAVLATDGNYVYVLKDGIVTHKLSPIDSDHTIVHESFVFIFLVLVFGFVVTLVSAIKA